MLGDGNGGGSGIRGLTWERIRRLGDAEILALLGAWKRPAGAVKTESELIAGLAEKAIKQSGEKIGRATPRGVFEAACRWRGIVDPEQVEKLWQESLAEQEKRKRDRAGGAGKKRRGGPNMPARDIGKLTPGVAPPDDEMEAKDDMAKLTQAERRRLAERTRGAASRHNMVRHGGSGGRSSGGGDDGERPQQARKRRAQEAAKRAAELDAKAAAATAAVAAPVAPAASTPDDSSSGASTE